MTNELVNEYQHLAVEDLNVVGKMHSNAPRHSPTPAWARSSGSCTTRDSGVTSTRYWRHAAAEPSCGGSGSTTVRLWPPALLTVKPSRTTGELKRRLSRQLRLSAGSRSTFLPACLKTVARRHLPSGRLWSARAYAYMVWMSFGSGSSQWRHAWDNR